MTKVQKIKELRRRTGATFQACKYALFITSGNLEQAAQVLVESRGNLAVTVINYLMARVEKLERQLQELQHDT